jgi:hypothetical protein
MDAVFEAARLRGSPSDIFFANTFYRKEDGIMQPGKDLACDIGYVPQTTFDYIQAEKELANLRKSVIDESMPFEIRLMKHSKSRWGGGRYWDAFLLGTLRNPVACPELAEAAEHDLRSDMRARCMESMMWIGRGAYDYADKTGRMLHSDKDPYVWYYAAKALGKMGNPAGIGYLCDKLEDLAPVVNMVELDEPSDDHARRYNEYACMTLSEALASLVTLDEKLGRGFVSSLLVKAEEGYGLLRHYVKRAVSLKNGFSLFWQNDFIIL